MPSATGSARRDETPAAASSAGVSTAPRARRSRLRAPSSARRLGGLARCPVDEIRQHLPEPLWSIEVERYRREEERRAAKRLHDRRSRMREQICRVRPSARVEHPLPERAELRVGLEARQGRRAAKSRRRRSNRTGIPRLRRYAVSPGEASTRSLTRSIMTGSQRRAPEADQALAARNQGAAASQPDGEPPPAPDGE